ncbi:MAG: hypothetical protein ICV77_16370, partial [Cyanobacteria bacterium Co-bin8]|nr:hypothetical protein [Cyanobacteria bacterium Co-bin8]
MGSNAADWGRGLTIKSAPLEATCQLLIETMVLNNSLMLLAVPSSKGTSGAAGSLPEQRVASLTDMNLLTRTLTHALYSDSPLPDLASGLGIQLAADACVFIGRHLPTGKITLTLWQPQTLAQVWQFCPNLSASLEAAQLALKLIREACRAADAEWQQALERLLSLANGGDWLGEMRSHYITPIRASAETEGIVLLLSREEHSGRTLHPALAEEIGAVVALAFHQHHLHQQAHHSLEQLRYLNQLKDDFLSTLNHELRTPL